MLGAKLKRLRESRKLTQNEMAKLIDVKREAYSHYETGRRKLSPQAILRLANVFEISIDYLFGLTETPTPLARDFQEIESDTLLHLQQKLNSEHNHSLHELTPEDQATLLQLVSIALKHRSDVQEEQDPQ